MSEVSADVEASDFFSKDIFRVKSDNSDMAMLGSERLIQDSIDEGKEILVDRLLDGL